MTTLPTDLEKHIKFVANAMSVGADDADIHAKLFKDGLSESDIFLVMKAGDILFNRLKELQDSLNKERAGKFMVRRR